MARIIVIEDENILCKVLVEILNRRGHEADSARSAAQGQKMLDQESYDVALVDVCLPDMDGLELAKRIRNETKTGVILMSGGSESMDEGFRQRAKSHGVSEVIHKPFLVEKLLGTIAGVLKRPLSMAGTQAV